jgi:hypothetical protein
LADEDLTDELDPRIGQGQEQVAGQQPAGRLASAQAGPVVQDQQHKNHSEAQERQQDFVVEFERTADRQELVGGACLMGIE